MMLLSKKNNSYILFQKTFRKCTLVIKWSQAHKFSYWFAFCWLKLVKWSPTSRYWWIGKKLIMKMIKEKKGLKPKESNFKLHTTFQGRSMWKTKRQIYKENVIKIKFYEETVNFYQWKHYNLAHSCQAHLWLNWHLFSGLIISNSSFRLGIYKVVITWSSAWLMRNQYLTAW